MDKDNLDIRDILPPAPPEAFDADAVSNLIMDLETKIEDAKRKEAADERASSEAVSSGETKDSEPSKEAGSSDSEAS